MFCLEIVSCVILGDNACVPFDCVYSRGKKCAAASITATYATVTRLLLHGQEMWDTGSTRAAHRKVI